MFYLVFSPVKRPLLTEADSFRIKADYAFIITFSNQPVSVFLDKGKGFDLYVSDLVHLNVFFSEDSVKKCLE